MLETKFKNKKVIFNGSVLVVSMVVLSIILIIALNIAFVVVRERKASLGSVSSTSAFQEAETGVEEVMYNILKEKLPTSRVRPMDNCQPTGNIEAGNYIVVLYDIDGDRIGCNNNARLVSDVAFLKSTGISGDERRSIQASVVFPD